MGAPRQTAVTTALWSAIAFEPLAGLRSHATAGELPLETFIGAAMGLGILALKAILRWSARRTPAIPDARSTGPRPARRHASRPSRTSPPGAPGNRRIYHWQLAIYTG